jgi:hypothetical protein
MSRRKGPGRLPGTKARPVDPHKRNCLVIGGFDDPVVAVEYTAERHHAGDSGFTLYTTSAPRGEEEATEDNSGPCCLACLAREHPEGERGLKLARVYLRAWWDEDEGSWVAEDEEGLEVVFDSGDEVI